MILKAVIHDTEEGGFWAEVPALPGCFTQGETIEELHANLQEAVRGCLAVLNERKGRQIFPDFSLLFSLY